MAVPRAEMRKRFTKEKVPLRQWLLGYGGFDFPFLIAVTVLLCIGLVMMFSASYVFAARHFGDPYHFIRQQAMWAVVGFALMLVVSKVNPDILRRFGFPIIVLVVAVVLLVIALVTGTGGFRRWITIPGVIQFQPSEVAKVAIIWFFAYAMEKFQKPGYAPVRQTSLVPGKRFHNWLGRWWPSFMYFIVLAMVAGLVFAGDHVSGAIIITGIGFMMIFIGEQRIPLLAYAIPAVGAVGAVAAVFNNPNILPDHAAARIISFLDPASDPTGGNWQIRQSLYAVGSGGWFGQGWGRSIQKHLYLPEPQNDFVFAIVAEELGFIGAILIVALFVFLVWRGFVIALRTKDRFYSLFVLGIVLQVGLQTALNIAVVTGMVPNTGIPLPFFSYGGTALVVLMAQMGVVLAISRTSGEQKMREIFFSGRKRQNKQMQSV